MDSRLEEHRPDKPVRSEQGETVGGDVRVLQVELHVVAAGREPLEQEDHEGGRLYGNDTNLCLSIMERQWKSSGVQVREPRRRRRRRRRRAKTEEGRSVNNCDTYPRRQWRESE